MNKERFKYYLFEYSPTFSKKGTIAIQIILISMSLFCVLLLAIN